MHRIVMSLVAAVAVISTTGVARADLAKEAALCRDEATHPDVRIGACTYLIRWGDHSEKTLSAAFHARGRAYSALDDNVNAISDLSEAIRLNPVDPAPYDNRANIYMERREYDMALADFAEALRLDSQNGSTFNNRGTVYLKLADYHRALAHYDEAIRLDPDLMLAYNNRCVAWRYLGELVRSAADCTRALELAPSYWRAWMNRGITFYLAEQYAVAADDYQAAIRLNPQSAAPYNALAWLRATAPEGSVRDGAEATRLAERAVEMGDTPQHRDTLAAAYAEAGLYSRAVEEEERAIHLLRELGGGGDVTRFHKRLQLYREGRPYRQR